MIKHHAFALFHYYKHCLMEPSHGVSHLFVSLCPAPAPKFRRKKWNFP